MDQDFSFCPVCGRATTRWWSNRHAEILRQMWEDGEAASVISRKLGVSRNAVIAKARRMQLSRRESPIIRLVVGE